MILRRGLITLLGGAAMWPRVVGAQPTQTPLSAGEIITTGTITNAWPIERGQTWTSDYGVLGLHGLTLTLD